MQLTVYPEFEAPQRIVQKMSEWVIYICEAPSKVGRSTHHQESM